MDVKLESITNVKSDTYATNGLPSMALDSGSPCRNDAIFAIMRIAGPELFGFTRLEKLQNPSLESFGGSAKLLSSGMHCFGQSENTHSVGLEPCGRSAKPQTSAMHSFGQSENTHSIGFKLFRFSVNLHFAD